MIFSADFKDQIRRCIRIADVISRYVPLQRRGTRLLGLCPFHQEKTPSFYVFDHEDSYHCFGCRAHGDIFSFVQHMQNVDFPTAVEMLATEAGLTIPEDSTQDDPIAHKRRTYLDIMEAAADFFQKSLYTPAGQGAMAYLTKRGMVAGTIETFRLGYAPGKTALKKYLMDQKFDLTDIQDLRLLTQDGHYDFFNNRLMFPITNRQNQVIAFGGRTLDGRDPKYINSADTPIFQKSFHLYGYVTSRKSEKRDIPVIICEGYMDVLALYQGGYEKAVAPLGTALTPEQIQLAWRLTPQPIICFDGDTAGQRAAQQAVRRVLPILKPNHTLNFIVLPKGEDPDSLLTSGQKETFGRLLLKPVALADKLWQGLIAGFTSFAPEQQAYLKEQIKDVCQTIEHADIRKAYVHHLNSLFYQVVRGPGDFKKKNQTPAPNLSRRTIAPKRLLQEKILLSLLLNYPEILDEVNETLGRLELTRTDFKDIKELLLSYVNEEKELDRTAIESHLTSRGYEAVYTLLMDKGLILHEAALGPKGTKADALKAFEALVADLDQAGHAKEGQEHLKQKVLGS